MSLKSWLRAQFPASSTHNHSRKAKERRNRSRPVLERLEDRLAPSAGQLDPTFGVNGVVNNLNIGGPTPSTARAIVVTEGDGKVIVAGTSDDPYGGHRLAVLRFNSDGSADGTFGNQGTIIFNLTASNPDATSESPAGLAIDSGGHIIVGAGVTTITGGKLEVARLNSNGSFDTTFGSNGKIILDHFANSYSESASSIALDSSGHILIAGSASSRFAVARLNADGSLDNTFGSGGEMVVPDFGNYFTGPTVITDSSGHIVLTGTASGYFGGNYGNYFAVARLNTDGSLDSHFGQGGEALLPQFSNFYYSSDSAAGATIDAVGRVIVVGSTYGSFPDGTFGQRMAVARLNTDGSLDNTFGTSGQLVVPSFRGGFYASDSASSVAATNTGQLVIAGISGQNLALARLKTDGSLDPSFGTNGETILPQFSNGNFEIDTPAGMATDANGRFVIAATSQVSGLGNSIAVTRVNTDGSLDSTWGGSGQITANTPGGTSNDNASSMTLTQPDGKIVVVGTSSPQFGPSRLAVTRYNSDGSLDAGFGTGGIALFDNTGTFSLVPTAISLDASGRILIAGQISTSFFKMQFAVARLNANGSLDTSFGSGGESVLPVFGNNYFEWDRVAGMAVDASGRIVLAGTAPAPYSDSLALARLNADGSLDNSFGTGGQLTLANISGAYTETGAGLTIDSSGRILIGATANGYFGSSYGSRLLVTRLKSDGTVDGAFGASGTVLVPQFTQGYYENDQAVGVALDSLGRIVVAGSSTSSNYSFMAARFNADGSPDSTFGVGGQSVISNFGSDFYIFSGSATRMAIDANDRIAIIGYASGYHSSTGKNGTDFAVGVFKVNGCPDVDFGADGATTTSVSNGYYYSNVPTGAAFDSTGRLVVAGSSVSYPDQPQSNFTIVRYLTRDPIVDAGSSTFAASLQAAITGFRTNPPAGTPRVVVHIANQSQMATVASAISNLTVSAGPDIEVLLDIDPGTYTLGSVTVPASLRLIVDGQNSFSGARILTSTTIPALTVVSGNVVIRGGVGFTSNGSASDLVVKGGQVSIVGSGFAETGNVAAMQVLGGQVSLQSCSFAETGAAPALLLQSGQVSMKYGGINETGNTPAVQVQSGTLGMTYVPVTENGNASALLVQGGQASIQSCTITEKGNAPALLLQAGQFTSTYSTITENGNASAIQVQGGQLIMRGSTVYENNTASQTMFAISGGQVDLGAYYDGNNYFSLNGPGMFIQLTGPNNVLASGDTFVLSGRYLYDYYQLENLIDHSLDSYGPGTVFLAPNTVFITTRDAVIQRGVNAVTDGGVVYVQSGVKGPFTVGSKLITINYQSGQSIVQMADTLDPTKRELFLNDSYNTGDSIKFVAGTNPGEVQVNLNNLPNGTFLPTGRIVAYGGNGANITVDNTITLSAWLYAGGNSRLKGGGGNNILIGSGNGDLLVGGSGRDIIIGHGGDRLVSTGGQDILIGGSTVWDYNEVALGAIMAEWTSADSLATRIADLTDNTASPYFSANRLNGDYFLIGSGPNQTVFSDFSADTITAGSGPDLIFASSSDKVTGLTSSDLEFIIGS
jgi:uncharacterized delta-60 repeat protein